MRPLRVPHRVPPNPAYDHPEIAGAAPPPGAECQLSSSVGFVRRSLALATSLLSRTPLSRPRLPVPTHLSAPSKKNSVPASISTTRAISTSNGRIVEKIGNVTSKLDVLEVRNPGIAAGELVSRRAWLAQRERGLGGALR